MNITQGKLKDEIKTIENFLPNFSTTKSELNQYYLEGIYFDSPIPKRRIFPVSNNKNRNQVGMPVERLNLACRHLLYQSNRFDNFILKNFQYGENMRFPFKWVFKQNNIDQPTGLYLDNIIYIYYSKSNCDFIFDYDVFFHELSHHIFEIHFPQKDYYNSLYRIASEAYADFITLQLTGKSYIGAFKNHLIRDYSTEGSSVVFSKLSTVKNTEKDIYLAAKFICEMWRSSFNRSGMPIKSYLRLIQNTLNEAFNKTPNMLSIEDYIRSFED